MTELAQADRCIAFSNVSYIYKGRNSVLKNMQLLPYNECKPLTRRRSTVVDLAPETNKNSVMQHDHEECEIGLALMMFVIVMLNTLDVLLRTYMCHPDL